MHLIGKLHFNCRVKRTPTLMTQIHMNVLFNDVGRYQCRYIRVVFISS